jgi:transcriptional regulator with XRE-family HTH domain
MIQPRQIRAARALLNWSQQDLAKTSGIAISSIKNIENDLTVARRDTLSAIQEAFEKAGVEFLPSAGVRLQMESINVLKGTEALQSFFDDIYQTLRQSDGGEVLVSGVEEKTYDESDKKLVDMHLARMKALGNVSQKILSRAGDRHFTVPYGEYRWVDAMHFAGTPFYVYGDKLAMLIWQPSLHIIVLHYPQLVDAYRKQFFFQWERAEIPAK